MLASVDFVLVLEGKNGLQTKKKNIFEETIIVFVKSI